MGAETAEQKFVLVRICKHCKKPEGDHTAVLRHCPIGRKHPTFGYTYGTRTFELGRTSKRKVKKRFTL